LQVLNINIDFALLLFNILSSSLKGVSVGPKPDFSAFLQPIINELKALECGSVFDFEGGRKEVLSFFTISGVFDKPARASVLNIKSVNCYYGCLKCLQEGTVSQTSKGD
jgi:hypothetical protein